MEKTPGPQQDEETLEKLRHEVKAASEAYFRAAAANKEAIHDARSQGWKLDADGHHSLHSAAQLEIHQLRIYAGLVKALQETVRRASAPLKSQQSRSRKLAGMPLSVREKEILKLIAEGLSSREIADKLKISFKTAVAHRYHIMAKLGIHDVVTLVRYALRNELIKP